MDGIPRGSLCALLLAGTAMCVWTGQSTLPNWEFLDNWTEHQPGPDEGALFGDTPYRDVQIDLSTNFRTILFTADAPQYRLSLVGEPLLDLTGAGVVNDSAAMQQFLLQPVGGLPDVPEIWFEGGASASGGTGRVRYSGSGRLIFSDSATAGNADIDLNGGTVHFGDSARAGTATIAVGSGTRLEFADGASADQSSITVRNGGALTMDRTPGGKSITILEGGTADIATGADGPTSGGPDVTLFGALRFHAPGAGTGSYSISRLLGSGSIDLGGAGDGATALYVGSDGSSASFQGSITGRGSLTKLGAGTFVLSGSNHATGGLRVAQGRLFVSPDALGDGPIVIDDRLYISEPGADRRIAATISGPGRLYLSSGNKITLAGANGYSGGTEIQFGTFGFTNPGAFGSGTITIGRFGAIMPESLVAAAGAKQPLAVGGAGPGGFSLANPIFLNDSALIETGFSTVTVTDPGAARIDTNGRELTLSGGISGPGDLDIRGGGRLILTADATHTGLTTIRPGTTLQLGNGGAGGSLSSDIDVLGALEINLGRDFTYDGFLAGNGSILVGGTGLTTFLGDGDFDGLLTIGTTGRLQLGDGTVGGGGAIGNIADNGRLIVNLIGTNRFGGTVSGTGSVELKAGTTVLTAANSYTGGTTIDHGATLQLGDGTTDGTITGPITDDGTILVRLKADTIVDQAITGSGSVRLAGSGKVTVISALDYRGGTTIDPGSTLELGDGIHGGSVEGDIIDNGLLIANLPDDATSATQVSGTGAFRLTGGHRLTLTGTSSFTGGTTIDAGSTLRLGDGLTDGGIAGNVADNGLLDFNLRNATVFGGLISGSGSILLSGPGKVTLTANNGFSGTTEIAPGASLQLGGGGTTGMVSGPVAIGGALTIDRSDNVTYTGALSGAGTLTKAGAGALVYNGDGHGFSGALTVASGSFMLGDLTHPEAALGGSATVADGATLLGHGALGGSLVNNGMVRPGGSIGTLSVAGSYTQAPGATLTLDVEPGGASKLAVGGAAQLAGTLALVYAPGTYSAHDYDLVTAAGGINGTFATVTGSVPSGSVSQTIAYTPNAVRLTLANIVVAPDNPSVRAFVPVLLADNAIWDEAQDLERARGARRGIWTEARGRWGRSDGRAGMPGWNNDVWGLAGGINLDPANTIEVGLEGAWSHSDIGLDDGGSGAAETVRIAGTARYTAGPLRLLARGSAAWHKLDANRIASPTHVAGARFDAHEIDGAVEAGWRFGAGAWTLTPRVGASVRLIRQNDYVETGSGSFDVAVNPDRFAGIATHAGLSASRDWTLGAGAKLTAAVDLDWLHELADVRGTATAVALDGTRFPIAGPALARDRLIGGLALDADLSDRVTLFAKGRVQPGLGGSSAQSVSGGLRIRF